MGATLLVMMVMMPIPLRWQQTCCWLFPTIASSEKDRWCIFASATDDTGGDEQCSSPRITSTWTAGVPCSFKRGRIRILEPPYGVVCASGACDQEKPKNPGKKTSTSESNPVKSHQLYFAHGEMWLIAQTVVLQKNTFCACRVYLQ